MRYKRDREIEEVMKMISTSIEEHGYPPMTTQEYYKMGKILGKGAYGKVNLSMHKLTRKLVAVKCMKNEYLKKEESRRKLENESTILKRIRHQNVVK